MIDNTIMTFTKVFMAPHPCAPPQGGDRKVFASLEMVCRGASRLVRIQS